ncbi:hypothetical protein K440DRAFT_600010 [Wilcoxina mikolae CBS 423.85]|nr:hypothetical protein K440DRAFT_600010 [Wilcoxina mikolae CBS 423.85]
MDGPGATIQLTQTPENTVLPLTTAALEAHNRDSKAPPIPATISDALLDAQSSKRSTPQDTKHQRYSSGEQLPDEAPRRTTSTTATAFSLNDAQSIFYIHQQCVERFNELVAVLNPSDEILKVIYDEFGRFKIWTENAGAHRTGRISLDHRLREASRVRSMVIKLLGDLKEVLEEDNLRSRPPECPSATSHAHGSQPEETDSEEEIPDQLEDCCAEITDIVTSLYEISITIHNATPRDRLERCSKIPIAHFEFYDIQHLQNMFPAALPHLHQRFGKANMRRRQLLKYHEQHNKKITGPVQHAIVPLPVPTAVHAREEETLFRPPVVSSKLSVTIPITTSSAKLTQTTAATTFVPRELQDTFNEGLSEAGYSQTSFATTASGEADIRLRVPHPPDPESAYAGQPFECSLCYAIIRVSGRPAWK